MEHNTLAEALKEVRTIGKGKAGLSSVRMTGKKLNKFTVAHDHKEQPGEIIIAYFDQAGGLDMIPRAEAEKRARQRKAGKPKQFKAKEIAKAQESFTNKTKANDQKQKPARRGNKKKRDPKRKVYPCDSRDRVKENKLYFLHKKVKAAGLEVDSRNKEVKVPASFAGKIEGQLQKDLNALIEMGYNCQTTIE